MDRRSFLRTIGLATGALGAGALVSGCSPEQTGIPDGSPGISVGVGSFEVLTGEQRPINLLVTENDQTPIRSEVQVYLRTPEGEVLNGPHATTYHPATAVEVAGGLGVHQAILPLPEPGTVEVVAVTGGRYGVGALNVVAPDAAQAPVPGQPAVSTATPTTANDLGVSPLCTEDPPCPLHEVSLDQALGGGRPVLLLFATPRYCQTAVCAPAVGNLVSVQSERDWGEVAFIHCEIYPSDEEVGSSFVQAVTDWGLPTEPWLFAVDADGVISDRLDGPMLADDMRRLANAVA